MSVFSNSHTPVFHCMLFLFPFVLQGFLGSACTMLLFLNAYNQILLSCIVARLNEILQGVLTIKKQTNKINNIKTIPQKQQEYMYTKNTCVSDCTVDMYW